MLFSLDIIGTHLHIQIETSESCDELFLEIGARLRAFEERFSRFIPGNWLDRLNTEKSGILDEDGRLMLEYALYVARDTGGYFDPTIAGRLSSLGYGRQDQRDHPIGWQHIHLDGDRVTLEENVILEYGGVGKGYLIDVIRSMIEKRFEGDIPRYLIDFGGDLYGYGAWKVGLENPHNLEEVIGTIDLTDDYLACSSGSKRKWGDHHHLIDPKTGASSEEVIATYIEGRSGISTDSYATALAVMPFQAACELLYRSSDLEGIILAKDGRYFQSEGSKSVLFTGE